MRQVVGGCAEGGIVPQAAGARERGVALLLVWRWQKKEAGSLEARDLKAFRAPLSKRLFRASGGVLFGTWQSFMAGAKCRGTGQIQSRSCLKGSATVCRTTFLRRPPQIQAVKSGREPDEPGG